MFARFAAGDLKVVFDEENFNGLDGVQDAIEHLLSGRSMGKVIAKLNAAE
jgi:NADPH-dependent curcumin reductase CurA